MTFQTEGAKVLVEHQLAMIDSDGSPLRATVETAGREGRLFDLILEVAEIDKALDVAQSRSGLPRGLILRQFRVNFE